MPELIVTLIGLGIGLASILIIRRRMNTLPNVSDEAFLEKFNAVFRGVSAETVLQERMNVARQLGVDCKKLDPTYTLAELSKKLDFLGSFELSLGDLESVLSELFEKSGAKQPPEIPSSVGELIYEIAKAKQSGRSGSPSGDKSEA